MENSGEGTARIPEPTALNAWLSANSWKLKPPVNNACIHSGKDFILMAVGGPNKRNDFHINESEEWFFQMTGSMILRIVENNEVRDITIKEGESFLLPGNTPHSPIRFKDTIGLVMETTRPPKSIDRLRWYCANTAAHGNKPTIIKEDAFYCENIETELKEKIDAWVEDEAARRCGECGTVAPPHLTENQ